MTIIRKVRLTPTYQKVEPPKKLELLSREIIRFRPKVEATPAGSTEKAIGKIIEWFPKRHFFSVQWIEKSVKFDKKIDADSDLKVYFKAQLFSTQLLFKSNTVRQVDPSESHFRIPEEIYQQQRRGALRVPLKKGAARLVCPQGEFPIIDLSMGGARLKKPPTFKKRSLKMLGPCTLILGRELISSPSFKATITYSNDELVRCKFQGFSDHDKILLLQYLSEALRIYYEAQA